MDTLRNAQQSTTGLVEKYINSAFDQVQAVAEQITSVADISALIESGDFAKVAEAVEDIESIADLMSNFPYLGAFEDEPTTRLDGSLLIDGDLYFDTGLNMLMYYEQGWKSIGSVQNTLEIFDIEAGNIVDGVVTLTLENAYTVGANNLMVFVNNAFQYSYDSSLRPEGLYTETNALTVTFRQHVLEVGDQVSVIIGNTLTNAGLSIEVSQKVYEPSAPGEHIITLPEGATYTMGNNSLAVYLDGVLQEIDEQYTETTDTQITFITGIDPGQRVIFKIGAVISHTLPRAFDDLGSMTAQTALVNGQMSKILGRDTPGDGADGTWVYLTGNYTTEVTLDTLKGKYAPADNDPTGAAGCHVRLNSPNVYNSVWFGSKASATPAVNLAAMQIMAALLPGGGLILQPDSAYLYDAGGVVSLPSSPNSVHIKGIGHQSTEWIANETGNSDYLLTFEAASGVCCPTFERISVNSDDNTRQEFMGVDVKASNQARWIDCMGYNAIGTVWRIERPHNSRIKGLGIYYSGDPANDIPSFLMCAKANLPANGETGNDVFIEMTFEQNYHTAHIENIVNFQPGSRLKVHGSANQTRVLHLHNVMNGQLGLLLTLGCTGDDMVMYTDQASDPSAERYEANIFTGYNASLLITDVFMFRNIAAQAEPSSTAMAVIRTKLNDSLSAIKFRGIVPQLNAGGSYEVVPFHFEGDGVGNIDITDVAFLWDGDATYGRIRDDRSAKRANVFEREGAIHVPFKRDADDLSVHASDPLGLLETTKVGGVDSPEHIILAHRKELGGVGWKGIQLSPISGQLAGPVSADATIAQGVFPLSYKGASGGVSMLSRILRLGFSAIGIPATLDDLNKWELEVYHLGSIVATLNVCQEVYDGDTKTTGYPDVAGNAYGTAGWGVLMMYGQGIPTYSSGLHQAVSFVLRKTGAPTDLSNIFLTAWFEQYLAKQA